MDEYNESYGRHEYPDPDYAAEITRYPWVEDSVDQVAFAGHYRVPDSSSDRERTEHQLGSTAGQEVGVFYFDSLHDATNNPSRDLDYQSSDNITSADDHISDASTDSSLVNAPGNQYDVSALGRGQSSRSRGSTRRGRRGRPRGLGRGGKGIKRGLRKPLEPAPEFKALHSGATMAYIAHDYEKAEQLTLEALLLNPEMYQAHSLLSEIHAARGDKDKALSAAWNGAHTRPRDTQMWSRIARLVLERDGENRRANLRDAIYCYNRIISVDKTNVEARYQRAALNRELGHKRKVVFEYEQLIKQLPHDTTVLRHLAEIYIELNEPDQALRHYEATIAYFQAVEPDDVTSFTWSDVNIVAELYGFQQRYDEAISMLKSLARWLLGRRGENFWETFEEDDREWDLDDQPRRVALPDFVAGAYEAHSYGGGLPLELRIKLGIFRLYADRRELKEAINHFQWLEPEADHTDCKVYEYPDLFREVGNALCEREQHQEALRFYEPLRKVVDYLEAPVLMELASCYRATGRTLEAQECYLTVVDDDEQTFEARSALAEMRGQSGALTSTVANTENAVSVFKNRSKRRTDGCGHKQKKSTDMARPSAFRALASRPRLPSAEQTKIDGNQVKEKEVYKLFVHRRHLAEKLGKEDKFSNGGWIAVTKSLLEAFRSNKLFYPFDKHHKFLGYSKEARTLAAKPKYDLEALTARSGPVLVLPGGQEIVIPNEYCGIYFEDWLEIFLDHALTMARGGYTKVAYETIASAFNANVFYHSMGALTTIHVCWFTCALASNDDETLCSIARWFMREYQFVTDGYRLFSALNRLCDSENTWFNCGPSQKYILRQIKAVDFSFVGEAHRKSLFQERASYTTKDSNGDPIKAEGIDVALLMLYGHILYAGTSYAYAINYFLRALALDPSNPGIKLSLGLGYIHWALRRQAENRHRILMQGFAFLLEYYGVRQKAGNHSQRQESEYNVGRAYHLLGLTHLALPYYERCLALSEDVEREHGVGGTEDFAQEAAFALQGIWAANGAVQKAREITERWLTI